MESENDSQYSQHGSSVSQQAPSAQTPFTTDSTNGSHKYPSDLKTFQCPHANCGKAFNRPARLKDHLRSHNNDRVHKCPLDGCDKDFLRDSHLKHHIKSAHTELRDYVCDWEGCGKAFVTATRLRRHAAVHEGREKYRCTEHPPCDETFRKHATLQRHIIAVHLGQKPFQCTHTDAATGEQCSEGFDTAGRLKAHEGRIHGGTRFFCIECPESDDDGTEVVSYSTYADLQTHIRTEHPPTCSHCSIVCSTTRELRRHIDLAHGGQDLLERQVYLCSYTDCNRGFTKKGNLNVHVRTVHEGEKRFICGETDLSTSKKVEGWMGEGACGGKFGAKLSLEEHVRTAHMGLTNSRLEGKPRKEKKRQKRTQDRSLLTSLTGADYQVESGRHIPCIFEGCAYMFYRDYDLEVHLRSMHGASESELRDIFLAEGDPSNDGGILWRDHDRDMEVNNEPDLMAQEELDRQYDMLVLDDEYGRKARGFEMERDFQLNGEASDAFVDPILRYLNA
jgi:general transcription factor IIIA